MTSTPTALDLLRHRAATPCRSGLLSFGGVSDRDVYNLTAPFLSDGTTYVAARVEARNSEQAHIRFFTEDPDGRWVAAAAVGAPELQDPFTFVLAGRRYVGGVKVVTDPESGMITSWSTVVLRGPVPDDLEVLVEGPAGMKDIRFVDLDDRVGVFTRPQGEVGGRGTIGFTTVEEIERLDPAELEAAPLLDGQFAGGEWGGANEAHHLGDGRVGVLGHVAYFDDAGDRHYYAMAFVFDTGTGDHSPLRIVATRSDFPPGPAKRPDLRDVIFPGGLIRHPDGTATLYAGLGDAQAGWADIRDPFASI